MWVAGTRHCQRVAIIFQAIVSLVFNRSESVFLFHAGFESTALNHEVIDDTMENCAVVEAFAYVRQEVFNGFWGFFGV